ncbi:SAP domain-containing protein [Loigolactobacillus binensis]|uniref:SAP domain-containing protein n=1 Tax=Loigolactobacillus binensis TaxID=2559922 RepID=A0ABW3ECM9_9LACO|nr:SAP domain-containing protein [Loigolactobacillus binensis]
MTPIKILALMLAAKQPTTFTLTQPFWWHRYRVHPANWLTEFVTAELLSITRAPELSLQRQTVKWLKQQLRQRQLKISGRKAELIQRLQGAMTATELAVQFPQHYYQLTSTGTQLVQQNQFVLWLHQYYVAGIVDFTAASRTQLPTDLDLAATLNWLLDAAAKQAVADWPQRYYLTHLRFQFAWQTQHKGTALNALLDCIRIKLAGLVQLAPLTEAALVWPTTTYKIEPFYTYMLQQIRQEYTLSVADIVAAFDQRSSVFVLPRQLFSAAEMQQLLRWTLTAQDQKIAQLYQQKQKALLM